MALTTQKYKDFGGTIRLWPTLAALLLSCARRRTCSFKKQLPLSRFVLFFLTIEILIFSLFGAISTSFSAGKVSNFDTEYVITFYFDACGYPGEASKWRSIILDVLNQCDKSEAEKQALRSAAEKYNDDLLKGALGSFRKYHDENGSYLNSNKPYSCSSLLKGEFAQKYIKVLSTNDDVEKLKLEIMGRICK